MESEVTLIDTSSCIPKVTEVHSGILFDLLVVLAMMLGPLKGIATRFGGLEKVFPNSDPYGGLTDLQMFCDRAFSLLASPTFLEPPSIVGI
jgi:hypothetical protein